MYLSRLLVVLLLPGLDHFNQWLWGDISISNEQCELEKDESVCEIEKLLDSIQEKFMSWEAVQSMIWELSFDEGFEFLKAVDEARKLTQRSESLCLSEGGCNQHATLQGRATTGSRTTCICTS